MTRKKATVDFESAYNNLIKAMALELTEKMNNRELVKKKFLSFWR